jgi:hypothetical protein
VVVSATELLDLLRRKGITVRVFFKMADELSDSELLLLSKSLQLAAVKASKVQR